VVGDVGASQAEAVGKFRRVRRAVDQGDKDAAAGLVGERNPQPCQYVEIDLRGDDGHGPKQYSGSCINQGAAVSATSAECPLQLVLTSPIAHRSFDLRTAPDRRAAAAPLRCSAGVVRNEAPPCHEETCDG